MPSESPGPPQRLHPLSLLFSVGAAARRLLLPGIVLLVVSGGSNYEFLLMLFFIPAVVVAVVKYLVYSYRLGEDKMMVREGILIRNERHIPYARIQNVNLVQNPFHRLLNVAEVHLETASGSKPEAVIRVLSLASVETIRERVFRDKTAGHDSATDDGQPQVHRLLDLPTSELVLLGLISNRGMAVIAAALGVLWQFDLWGVDWEGVAERAPGWTEKAGFPSQAPGVLASIFLGLILLAVAVLVMKVLSIVWAVFRFYGFTLSRRGRDLRARYGLFTRYTATIPSHRIQLLSSHTTPLHRLFHRAGMLAETAGGGAGNEGEEQRETHRLWLAPILASDAVKDFHRHILPDVDLTEAEWTRLPALAIRRIRNRFFALTAVVSAAAIVAFGIWGLVVAVAGVGWSFLHARQWWKHAAWTVTSTAVAYRSGWWTRRASVVRFAKIQTVSVVRSPFDRRHEMARLVVDTAGAGKAGHRLNIPFLPFVEATRLHRGLAEEAAKRSFRW